MRINPLMSGNILPRCISKSPAFGKSFEFELKGRTLYVDDEGNVTPTNPDTLKEGAEYMVLAEKGHKWKKLKGGDVYVDNPVFAPLKAEDVLNEAKKDYDDQTLKMKKSEDGAEKEIESTRDKIGAVNGEIEKIESKRVNIADDTFKPYRDYSEWLSGYGCDYLRLGITPKVAADYKGRSPEGLLVYSLRSKAGMTELMSENGGVK